MIRAYRRRPPPCLTARPPREFPAGAFCALCVEPVSGQERREPLGRDGAMVNVCVDCATRPVTMGRYSFGAGRGGGQEVNLSRGPARRPR